MEFVLGGAAACAAGLFTNPLEVAKTRQQLQGELQAKGQYTKHYKNVGHAFITIGKVEGLTALQKGLVPALCYQLFMNGCRLGVYQCLINMGMTKDSSGKQSIVRCVCSGALAGCIGAAVGSPFYMVKTQLQAHANKEIAVGFQHDHNSMSKAFSSIYRQHGVFSLWRGISGALPRVTIGSAAQLSTFSASKEYVESIQVFKEKSLWIPVISSAVSGVVVVAFMTPFDVVSTRLYNQGTDSKGRGLLYNNVVDCFLKTFKKEGIWGFYKGWGASFFRLAPHTVLSLVFWNHFRTAYYSYQEEKESTQ